MDEYIDILDKEGIKTGKTCLKSFAHQKGFFHASTHIWFYTTDGNVLIQKRAANKKTFPNLWDVSVAGHVTAGEEEITSAIREVREEIGLTISIGDLHKIGIFKSTQKHDENFLDNEYHHVYLCELKTDINHLEIQKEEVAEIKLITLTQLEREISTPSSSVFYVPHKYSYYKSVFLELKKELSK